MGKFRIEECSDVSNFVEGWPNFMRVIRRRLQWVTSLFGLVLWKYADFPHRTNKTYPMICCPPQTWRATSSSECQEKHAGRGTK